MTEKEKITRLKKYHGYKRHTHAFFETRQYRKLKAYMISKMPNSKDITLNMITCDINDLFKARKYVIQTHTGQTNTKIPYTNPHYLCSKIVKKFGLIPNPLDYEDIIKYMRENSEYKEVTDIPISLNLTAPRNGAIQYVIPYINHFFDANFYENMPVLVSNIKLGGGCDGITISTYIHEMYHALIQRNKGNVENMLHAEMIPIFMEKVAALDIDKTESLVDIITILRLIYITNLFQKLNDNTPYHNKNILDIKNQGYILGTLEATALFEVYRKGKLDIKKEIDSDINRLITGNVILEDLIKKYEATPENGTKIIKRQIRKLF